MNLLRGLSLILSKSKNYVVPPSSNLFSLFAVPIHSRGLMDKASENNCKQRSENDANEGSKQLYAHQIMPHLLNLYGGGAKAQDFEIYSPHATFEDPLMCAHGVKQIKSAFYSLSKVFSESSIVEYTIDEKVISPGNNKILIDSKQHYKFLTRDIDMISLIVLSVHHGKIIRHEDRWNKKPLLSRETVRVPLVGRLIEVARRGSMFATHALMAFGKDPSSP